ncbi:YtxH domain-containing protein [Bacillus altitudinis]|uniref:YtxH domain-containing protein n=1 Tax=Bacillus pumilus TaxID=1408 RepID=UPI0025A01C78|nr:YtxH domain-containing protein [Bacillus pumilus]MDM5319153.1 YtxH domain-containing protein [Bacillus pumilus]MDR4994205.1 YtxH domain-containing protein [Bacillus altitudinis]
MEEKNQIVLRGALLGAACGALLTLFHRPTRIALKNKWNDCQQKLDEVYREPSRISACMKEKMEETKQLMRTVSNDLSFLNEQVNQLKETTPRVLEIIEETKDHFQSKQTD